MRHLDPKLKQELKKLGYYEQYSLDLDLDMPDTMQNTAATRKVVYTLTVAMEDNQATLTAIKDGTDQLITDHKALLKAEEWGIRAKKTIMETLDLLKKYNAIEAQKDPNAIDITFTLPRNTKNRKMNMVLNSNDRFNKFQVMETVKNLRQLAAYQGKALDLKPFTQDQPALLIVTVCPTTNGTMDPPNVYPTIKALVDGLTDAGAWTDDSHEVLKGPLFKYGGKSTEKGHYQITLRVIPYTDKIKEALNL